MNESQLDIHMVHKLWAFNAPCILVDKKGFHNHARNCHIGTHTHTRLMALSSGLLRWAGTRNVKPIWLLLKQETVSGSGLSWAICKSAPRSRQITTPAPHHSVFYRPDALPAAQPTASKHCHIGSLLEKWLQMHSICSKADSLVYCMKPNKIKGCSKEQALTISFFGLSSWAASFGSVFCGEYSRLSSGKSCSSSSLQIAK